MGPFLLSRGSWGAAESQAGSAHGVRKAEAALVPGGLRCRAEASREGGGPQGRAFLVVAEALWVSFEGCLVWKQVGQGHGAGL